MSPAPTAAKTRYAASGSGTYLDMYTADNTSGITGVATTDVRLGVSYGGGLVGTCAVPNPGTVAFGVAVDNTTGTATLTAANVRAALGMASANLDTQLAVLSNLDATVSSRLAPSGTLARVTLTDTATTLTNAPVVPSASAIASQVRTELTTELGRIDQNISSRLAATAYTAPPTPPTAAQVRAEMDANSTKLANLDATVSSRLAASAYTAPPTPPTAAQVRAEMDANSTQLAAIKSKTDALNTDRLAQTATTAIVGALIAQANS